jgi:hypothetical protein
VNRKSGPLVGVIAEDDCDVDSIRVLIHRIAKNKGIKINKFVGKGCGKLRRKCNAWARILSQKKCSVLILVHDLDANNLKDLRKRIQDSLDPCPIAKHLICIPVQEIEAWLLSDADAIKESMNLSKRPKVDGPPENIDSPKEYLEKLVYKTSGGEKIYLNTKHNAKIAEIVSIDKANKLCPSFQPFYEFVRNQIK